MVVSVALALVYWGRIKMNSTLEYLKSKEWSMGNGQCPECFGVHEGWYGHPLHMEPETIGHKKDCKLAKAIKDLGGDPLYLGEYKSDKQFENYIDDNGIHGIRPKTQNGCERHKKYVEEINNFCKNAILED